ncbi:hypothetical protein OV320_7859 [Actinobacteria bacterium OV320]|jgi:hypothetical protein|nr:hypothetical protein OV320_7859 [Actinobacteria bacterium OV320]
MTAPVNSSSTEVIAPATGFIYVAPANTPAPTWPFIPNHDGPVETAWKSIGNTSLDNGVEMTMDGDDPEVLGSWQDPALITTNPAKTYSLTMNLEDITIETLNLYYGGQVSSSADVFVIPSTPTPSERALFIAASDGSQMVGFHYPRASIIGSDSITLDPAAITEVPVTATILSAGSGAGFTGMGQVFKKCDVPTVNPTLP